jgi:transglutaminase-like putative cysteine protease
VNFQAPQGTGASYHYSVTLEPHNRYWLFALETAASLPERSRMTFDGQVFSNTPVRNRLRYDMVSIVNPDRDPRENRSTLNRALRLPPEYNKRTLALAQEWRRTGGTDADMLNRALDFLRNGRYTYTLEPPLLGTNSVDEFLFETKAGFCEHFASAFTVLMRAAGVPARVVTGYQGGDPNPVDGKFTVRQSDAHAWSEVHIEGRGWIRVDPTALSVPGRVDDGLARSVAANAPLPLLLRPDLQWLRSLRYNWEALTHQWNLLVLGYNPERQRDFMAWLGRSNADWLELASTLLAVLGAFVGALMLWTFARFARPDPVQTAWAQFCRKLGGRGLERAPHEGPQAYAERAARNFPTVGDAIRHIGSLYIALRYGRGGRPDEIAQLRRMVRELQFR